MPSGTLPIAPGTPAIASCRIVLRSGRIDRCQPASALGSPETQAGGSLTRSESSNVHPMTETVAVPPPAGARRPAAVSLVVVLAVLAGGFLLVDSVLDARNLDRDDDGAIAYTALQIALGLVALAIAVGALRVKPWAWKLFMTVAVAGLTTQILQYFFFEDPAYARLAIYAFIVFALTPRDMQIAFGIRLPPNVDLDRPTRNPLDRD
jgi:hypothetical protein